MSDTNDLLKIMTVDNDGLLEIVNKMMSDQPIMESVAHKLALANARRESVLLGPDEALAVTKVLLVTMRMVPLVLEGIGEPVPPSMTAPGIIEKSVQDAHERTGAPISELRKVFYPEGT